MAGEFWVASEARRLLSRCHTTLTLSDFAVTALRLQ
jgi:hypothetical protein